MDFFTKKNIIIICVVLGVIILGLILNPFVIINSEQKGLIFTFGSLSENILDAGLKIKAPFVQRVEKISMRALKIDFLIPVGDSGAITRDNQTIGANITIFYRYKKESLVKMWNDYGKIKIEELITATTQEVFKIIIGQYNIFELPLNQEEIRNKTLKQITEKIFIHPIEITEFKITNYTWSDEFDKQIAETMQKAQQVKQKEQELKITELESQKKVKEAEAEKQALITKAEGEKESTRLKAEAKVLEGEGIRKYNQSIAVNWGIELEKIKLEIEKERVAKWDGHYVPNNNYTPIPYTKGNLQGD